MSIFRGGTNPTLLHRIHRGVGKVHGSVLYRGSGEIYLKIHSHASWQIAISQKTDIGK